MLNVHLGRGVSGQRKIPHVIIMFVSGSVRRWKGRKHAIQACIRQPREDRMYYPDELSECQPIL